MNDFASNNDGGDGGGPAAPAQTDRQVEAGGGGDLYPQDGRSQLQGELNRLRGRLASPDVTEGERKQFRELSEFIHWNGPVPENMRSTPEVDPASTYDPMRETLAPVYEPAADINDFKPQVEREGVMTAADLQGLKEFALAAKLPPSIGGQILDRIIHHLQHEETGRLEPLDESGQSEYMEASMREFGGDETKLQQTALKARAYLERTMSPRDIKALDDSLFSTSVAWDPWVLSRLAGLFDARFGGGQ